MEYGKQLCLFDVSNGLKVHGILKKYADCKFFKLAQLYTLHLMGMNAKDRGSIMNRLNSNVNTWIKEWRYFPNLNSSQVWDGTSLIQVKDSVFISEENLVVRPTKKRDERISKNIDALKQLLPSKQKTMWSMYVGKYLPTLRKYWSNNFQDIPFPFPTGVQDFDESQNIKSMKGFLLFCMTHSNLQLRRKGAEKKDDLNFYPSFCIGNKSTFDVHIYFSKFVVFMLYTAQQNGTQNLVTNLAVLRLSKQTHKNITDNTKMTMEFYKYVTKFVSARKYDEFWDAASQMEASDRYYKSLFRVSPENFD
jgi:hypothetical protein